MASNKLSEYISAIQGKQLDALNLACEMMMFSFGEFELHAQCFSRIIQNNDLLVTTLDYQSWDGECDKNNDSWYFVSRFKEQLIGSAVTSVEISIVNDVTVLLDNGIQIQLYVSNGYHYYGEEKEQWVFFKRHDHTYPFITVNSKSVDIAIEW